MAGKIPEHFRFFWRDWVGSPAVLGMSLADQGAYLRMLCIQFEYGSIRPHLLPRMLGLSEEEVAAMLAGPIGESFDTLPDGTLVNQRLQHEREVAIGVSERNRRAALIRWAGKKDDKDEPKKKSRARINGTAEVEGAIELFEVRGVPVPLELRLAMEEYRQCRAENAMPVWRRTTWLKNMSEDFTPEQWAEAYRTSTRSVWRSVHPKKVGGGKGNPFASMVKDDLPMFADPNTGEVLDEGQ